MCATRLADRTAGPERVTELDLLDNEGAYAVALSQGLHRSLTSTLEDEAREVASRWEAGTCLSYLQFIGSSLFRGQRERRDGGFSSVDGTRLAAFLRAEPRGWLALLGAAAAVAKMVATAKLPPSSQLAAHRAGRDCWVFFTLALVHRPVASALFGLDDSEVTLASADLDTVLDLALRRGVLTEAQADAKTDELARGETSEASLCASLAPLVATASKAQARDIAVASAARLKGAMVALEAAAETRDPGSVVEANVFQAAAMLAYWCRELDVGLDLEAKLSLDNIQRAMYRTMAKPLGEATIRKGGFLNQQEYLAVLQPMEGGGGAKVGKKGGKRDGKRDKGSR
jgi:hypothetical protein